VRQAFLEGQSIESVHKITGIDPWFLYQIKSLAEMRNDLDLLELKQNGFSDK
jgi:hypothetical protein